MRSARHKAVEMHPKDYLKQKDINMRKHILRNYINRAISYDWYILYLAGTQMSYDDEKVSLSVDMTMGICKLQLNTNREMGKRTFPRTQSPNLY